MSAQGVARAPAYRRIFGWLGRLDDGALIRAAFFAMLAGTLCVLAIDYQELNGRGVSAVAAPSEPVLPAYDPESPQARPGPAVTTDRAVLAAPLAINLQSGGVLALTGTIDLGAAVRFAAEVAARGEYVKTVALDSPGGSVTDALIIGGLIRDKGFATSVAAGALCASSCPLVLAAGKKRLASPKAAIGVHQIYAMAAARTDPGGTRTVGEAMWEAQKTTADITRYLGGMGINAAFWLHALDTPPDRLYYFSPAELTALKLVTNLSD